MPFHYPEVPTNDNASIANCTQGVNDVRFGSNLVSLLTSIVFVLTLMIANGESQEQPSPAERKAIGGKWYVQERENDTPLYLYRDGENFLDLFSYHTQDSNNDGIPNVRLRHDDSFLIIESQGYPNHPTAVFPNSGNPNSIRVQNFTFRLPLAPKLAGEITRVPMGPIGMALNGVVFFNPFEMEGMNAVEGYSEVWLDSCCGHPQQTGVYHYHKYPTCVKSPFKDDGKQHSPIIGFAFDGFPLCGPYESDGKMAKDLTGSNALDVCNGHEDPTRGYHYHVTPGRFPYILGGYAGVVETSNNRGLRWAGKGALVDNTQLGENRLEKIITAVHPGTASRGTKHQIAIDIDPKNARRRAVPQSTPSWAQIGPFEAKKIERKDNVITIDIDIPDDAPVGVTLDCHIEFDNDNGRGGPMVYKLNDAFRVIP